MHNYLLLCNNNDNDNVICDDVTDTSVTNDEEIVDLDVEENTVSSDPIVKQDMITGRSSHDLEARSHDLEARSHDHDNTLNAQRNSNKPKKLSVNGLSYRRLLEKEELEDYEENTIVMEELSVETSDATAKHKSKKCSFIVKLKSVKDHATSTLLILLSLLKYDASNACLVQHSFRVICVYIYRDKVTFGTVFLYGLFSFATIGFDECFSLWASTSKPLGTGYLYASA